MDKNKELLNKWKEKIKKTDDRVIISLGALIILITLVIGISNNDGGIFGPKIVSSDVTVIKEFDNVLEEEDMEVRDELIHIIESGISGYYMIADRHFGVITTGGKSANDLEYTLTNGVDGSMTMEYRLGNISDDDYRVRYKIVETDKEIGVRKVNIVDAEVIENGIANIIVFEKSGVKYCYYERTQEIKEESNGMMPGIYSVVYVNGKLNKYNGLNYMELSDSQIVTQLRENVYEVTIGNSSNTLQVNIDNLNLKEGDRGLLILSYSNGFKGEFLRHE